MESYTIEAEYFFFLLNFFLLMKNPYSETLTNLRHFFKIEKQIAQVLYIIRAQIIIQYSYTTPLSTLTINVTLSVLNR